jgi:hypothetical protein
MGLITNRSGDHANLFWRLARAVNCLGIPASPGSVMIKVGKRIKSSRWVPGLNHDQNSAMAE